jgi:tRNA(His) 5'-end guanylyltransferase
MTIETKDDLGERMKLYEGMEAMRKLMPQLPIMCRLDGKAFHTFTKGLRRPFDVRFQQLMQSTTLRLVEETNAALGYTQSDEISLVILWNKDSEPYFGGRIQKICSTLAAVASVWFNKELPRHLPEKQNKLATFDCRVWNVPTLWEASNAILWREQDATKNSIQMAAQSLFSHKELQGLHSKQLQEKMFQDKGVNWNDYPTDFKRGSYFKRVHVETPFTTEELESLPPKHEARKNPSLVVKRAKISKVTFPKADSIKNLPDVFFNNAEPILK